MKQKKSSRSPVGLVVALAAGLIVLCVACALLYVMQSSRDQQPATGTPVAADPKNATLTLAYSPEKAALIKELVDGFNKTRQRTSDGQVMEVTLLEMPPDQMVQAALSDEPGFQALSPDASLWLDQIDLTWAERHRQEEGDVAARRIADSARYAVSPIVIATWPDVAASLRKDGGRVSWGDIQQRAATDPNFRWSHASTSYASGVLATLAEFYAGASKTRGLTEQDVLAQPTLDYVRDVERTISFYGENEAVAMQRMRSEGRKFLDALVAQEALVVQHNRSGGDPLVAIYPHEGTLWEDHPLALLDAPNVTDNQRRTFRALADFLLLPEQQQRILAQGFRPADLSLAIDGSGSPLSAANGVDPKEPQTTLQLPGPAVVQVVQNAWQYTKRPSNIYLVVDTSGSMEGDKLDNVKTALQVFTDQIQGRQDRVGMVEFASAVYNVIPPQPLDDAHRATLRSEIDQLQAGGDTALLDGIRAAYVRLQQQADAQSINAIVAMTDGNENASNINLNRLVSQIQRENGSGVPVVIFTIAYGDDADLDLLRSVAESSGGQMRVGSVETIRELYRLLSQYF